VSVGEGRSPEDYITLRFIYLVHRGESAASDVITASLHDLDLTGTHGLILEVLNAHPGISAAQVARYCGISRQAVLAPLGYLESRKLVYRNVADPRARVKPLELTGEGSRLAGLARGRVEVLEAQVMSGFSEGERELLRELLARYADSWESVRAREAVTMAVN